jgi:hypothetical protein
MSRFNPYLICYSFIFLVFSTLEMSIQQALQENLTHVVGPNLRLIVSSLSSDTTVEVNRTIDVCHCFSTVHLLSYYLLSLEIHWSIENDERHR